MKEINKENETVSEEVTEIDGADEFSTANLPSRKEIHGKKKQKTKVKIRFPFIKMLALFFVILLGTVLAVAIQMTKDDDSAASSEKDKSEYAESIGEISGFDDEEEAEKEAIAEEEASVEKPEADPETTEQEVAEEEVTEEAAEETVEETVVTTTETAGSTQQSTETTQQTTSSSPNSNGVTEHVVQSNENLFRIALKYYSSAEGVEIIKQYNGMSDNNIVAGQVLKIPPR